MLSRPIAAWRTSDAAALKYLVRSLQASEKSVAAMALLADVINAESKSWCSRRLNFIADPFCQSDAWSQSDAKKPTGNPIQRNLSVNSATKNIMADVKRETCARIYSAATSKRHLGPRKTLRRADCSLDGRVHRQIAWAKLHALRDGAASAS